MKILLITSILAYCSIAYAEWNISTPSKTVPATLEGSLFGREFTLGQSTWSDAVLIISSNDTMEGWPVSELYIFLGTDEEKAEWFVTPDTASFKDPHIHLKFAKIGREFPGTLMYTSEYSMYLKVLEKTEDSARIQIHISLPDYTKSTLIGTFETRIK